jgi:hypothetical protein
LTNLREVVLAVGMLAMEQQLGVLAQERQATSEQVPSRPHVGGIDISLRRQAAAAQDSDLEGVATSFASGIPTKAFRRYQRA